MFLIIFAAFLGAICAGVLASFSDGMSILLAAPLAASGFALLGACLNLTHDWRRGDAQRKPHPDIVWC